MVAQFLHFACQVQDSLLCLPSVTPLPGALTSLRLR